jgi:Uma2 family endonuclease
MVANLSVIPLMRHTLEEYYAMLEASDRRWEYWDGEFVCMAGGSPEHTIIISNLGDLLRDGLKGQGCRVFGEAAVNTPTLPPFRFPDLSVVCGKPEFQKVDRFGALNNPRVLIEVLSTSSEYRDKEPKRKAYQSLSSVQEYLLVAQSIPFVTRFVRLDKHWRRIEYKDLDEVIYLSSVACALPMSEIYRDIEFS